MKIKLFAAFFLLTFILQSQTLEKGKNYFVSAIGFWNVENLYDTLNDPKKLDEEFLPEGVNAWTGERYWVKINHMAKVISEMATDATPEGLSIIGFCEVENKNCLEDLARDPQLKARNYQSILIDGPYARGVDPGLMYNPKHFKFTNAVAYPVPLFPDTAYKTRDELVVTGFLFGEPIAIIVNHWPSRRGGELASRPGRITAAKIAKRIADSIVKLDPKTKVVILGDLNDDPTNVSIKKHLNTVGDYRDAKEGNYFNPMEPLFKQGIGSLAWQDSWNLFDQTILNKAFFPAGYKTFEFYKAVVFNKPYLKSDFGNFKGYPFRTYSGGAYTAGYSDHFPVYIILVKEKN
jgi:hypothetical protein